MGTHWWWNVWIKMNMSVDGWRIRGGESISRGAHLSDHNQEPAPVAIIIPLWVLVPRRMLTYCSYNYRTFRMTHIRFCLGCMHNWRICSSRVDLELEAAATHFCWEQQRLVFAWTWSIPPPHPSLPGPGQANWNLKWVIILLVNFSLSRFYLLLLSSERHDDEQDKFMGGDHQFGNF